MDPKIRYSYRDVPTVGAFHDDDATIRAIMGPFGSGKSSGCVVEIPQRALAMPVCQDGIKRSRWVVVRNTYNELRDTTIKTFHQWMNPEIFGRYLETTHEFHIKAFPGCEIEVLFRALDRPDHVRKLFSLEVTGAWINEAREVPWSIIEALQGRIGRYPRQSDCGPFWHGMWLDTNPPDQDSDWYRFFEESKHPKRFARLWKQPSGLAAGAENLANLPGGRGYYENLAEGKTKEFIKVYIHGAYGFVVAGKAVYGDDYNDDIHCSPDALPVPGAPIYRGWDWGLTPACIFCQMRPDGRFVVFKELTSHRMGADRFSDEVLEETALAFPHETPEFIDIGDPAGNDPAQTDERTCFDILHAKGIAIQGGLQSPRMRLESVRKPLTTLRSGRPQFLMHPDCRMLRKGFMGGYVFRRMMTKAERYTDKPDKSIYSHIHDALQYVCTIVFGNSLMESRVPALIDPDEEDERLAAAATRNQVTGY
jgi:hypothetical protein